MDGLFDKQCTEAQHSLRGNSAKSEDSGYLC